MTKLVTLAIVSDIHAFGQKDNASGALPDYTDTHPPAINPLLDLIQQVQTSRIKADILVCAGDISNRADATGLRHAWTDLQKLAEVLGNAQLVATNGNHDLDSRFQTNQFDPDPKAVLLALDPTFPFSDGAASNQYWTRHYVIVTHPSGVAFVVLNTSAYHGGKKEEADYGRVSHRTIKEICKELEKTTDAKAFILVCHHHPLPLSGWAGSDDTEFIRNGQILLDEISAVTSTSWLVIHGHRHLPQLIHGASNNNHIPFVFGAGSLGARVAGVPNQFHLLTLCTPPQSDHASISGVIETWLWTDANGWTAGTNNEALPGRCGFGYTGQIKYLADKISADCHSNGFNTWQEILSKFPSIGFLIPRAFEELETILQRLGINVLRDRHGKIVQVGK